MPFRYIDIHSHLNFAAFDADRDATLKRALDTGVAVINVGTQKDTSRKAVEIAEKYGEGVYAIVGTHPIHTSTSFHDEKELGEIPRPADTPFTKGGMKAIRGFTSRGEEFDYDFYKKLALHPKVVGIGECGLDYYRREPENEKKQREAFSAQIALANKVKKPLMLHVRNPSTSSGQGGSGRSAYRDALAILKSEAKVGGDFHFFAGSWAEAKEILDTGFSLSFTGVITFTHDYDEVVRNTPLDRILSETDAPYVAPAPYRGKRNEPSYVVEVVKAIADIKHEKLETVKERIFANAAKLFNLFQ